MTSLSLQLHLLTRKACKFEQYEKRNRMVSLNSYQNVFLSYSVAIYCIFDNFGFHQKYFVDASWPVKCFFDILR